MTQGLSFFYIKYNIYRKPFHFFIILFKIKVFLAFFELHFLENTLY